jgi:RNA polymerase sigma factor (sigma-70 family)
MAPTLGFSGGRKATETKPLTAEQQVLVEQNVRLAHAYANSRAIPRGMSPDDWHAECVFQLVRAATTYDPTRGTFATWAYKHMDYVAIHWRNYWGAVGRNLHTTSQLSEVMERGLEGESGVSLDSLQRKEVVDQYLTLVAVLPDTWQDSVRRICAGESYESIGASTGRSRQAIDQEAKRAFKFLRSWVERQGMECAI